MPIYLSNYSQRYSKINYSTVSPSTSHALVAKCAAEDLLNRILK